MSVDQYGQLVPANLRMLPNYCLCSVAERRKIFGIDWYECQGVLLADVVGDDPLDAGLSVDDDGNLTFPVLRVDDCLKRGDIFDGFYHA